MKLLFLEKQGARSIVAAHGVLGLYRGLLPTLLRDVPELALQFTLYESLRRGVEKHRKVSAAVAFLVTSPPHWHCLLGAIDGWGPAIRHSILYRSTISMYIERVEDWCRSTSCGLGST